VYRVLADGTVDSTLHWSDRGHDLSIHLTGPSATLCTAQDVFQMLGSVRRVSAAAPPPVAMAPPPPRAAPTIKSDP
jgi:hypothetical protein